MKYIIKFYFAVLALVCFLTFQALAQSTELNPPVGQFKFKGQVQLLLTKKSEFIPATTQAGQTRIAELKKMGWSCFKKTELIALCNVASKNEAMPTALIQQLQKRYAGVEFLFGALKAVQLINDAESLKEYLIVQDVRLNQSSTQTYRLQQMKDSLIKMQFDFSNIGKVYLNKVNTQTIAAVESLTTSGPNTSVIYFVQINFNK